MPGGFGVMVRYTGSGSGVFLAQKPPKPRFLGVFGKRLGPADGFWGGVFGFGLKRRGF